MTGDLMQPRDPMQPQDQAQPHAPPLTDVSHVPLRGQAQRVDDQGRQLCTAHAKATGGPCNAPAILGGTVCRMHGGSAPQTQDAARRRLAEAADPAAQSLIREATLSEKASDRIRAASEILDRAGVGRITPEQAEMLDAERVRLLSNVMSRSMVEAGIDTGQQRRVLESIANRGPEPADLPSVVPIELARIDRAQVEMIASAFDHAVAGLSNRRELRTRFIEKLGVLEGDD